eukprot:11779745-Alexandrium_andersonii.AAC.1
MAVHMSPHQTNRRRHPNIHGIRWAPTTPPNDVSVSPYICSPVLDRLHTLTTRPLEGVVQV